MLIIFAKMFFTFINNFLWIIWHSLTCTRYIFTYMNLFGLLCYGIMNFMMRYLFTTIFVPIFTLLCLFIFLKNYKLKVGRTALKNGNNLESNYEKQKPFLQINTQSMSEYSNAIKKQISECKFVQLFKLCYPDSFINMERIYCVIKYYVYGRSHDEDIEFSCIPAHRAINQLSKRFAKSYLLSKNELPKDMFEFLDIGDLYRIMPYSKLIKILHKYYVFKQVMTKMDLISVDINPFIRIWKHKDTELNKVQNVIILSQMDCLKDVKGYSTNNLCSTIYVETIGVTPYNILMFYSPFNNKIYDMDRSLVVKSYRELFSQFSPGVSVTTKNAMTIIVPYLVDHCEEVIGSIIMINPIIYPYSYWEFFAMIKGSQRSECSMNNKIISNLRDSYTLIKLLNRTSLLDLFFKTNMTNKKSNILYSQDTHVRFDKDHAFFGDGQHLTMLLEMYSKVNIIYDEGCFDVSQCV